MIEENGWLDTWLSDGEVGPKLGAPSDVSHYEWLKWLVLEQGLVPFEQTILWVAATSKEEKISLALEQLAENLELNSGIKFHKKGPMESHLLEHAIFRRLLVAKLLSEWLFPRLQRPTEELVYQSILFGDTHLDWLAAAFRYSRWDDRFYFPLDGTEGGSCLLDELYPLPHRVVCFEELPNMSALLDISGLASEPERNRKNATLRSEIAKVFLGKQMNQICILRHLVDTVSNYAREYPEIGTLLHLVLHCALLGNFPGSHHRPALATRIKVTLLFGRQPIGSKLTYDVDLTQILQFLDKYRRTVLFLMHEYFVSTCERDGVFDQIFSSTIKWNDYKAIVRYATGRIRLGLAQQTEQNFWAKCSWLDMEETRDAEIQMLHNLSLMTAKKIKKGRAEQLIVKKMISVETSILSHHLKALYTPIWWIIRALNPAPSTPAALQTMMAQHPTAPLDQFIAHWNEHGHKFSSWKQQVDDFVLHHGLFNALLVKLEQMAPVFHRIAAAAAQESMRTDVSQRTREIIPLRYLQVLGLSEAQGTEVKRWVHDYYVYDQPDNKYRTRARLFGQQSLYAHIVVKTYFRLFTEYRTEQLVVRPIGEALRIQTALRNRLNLLPSETSPADLGTSLYCRHCQAFKRPLKNAPFWIELEYDEKRSAAFSHAAQQANGRLLTVDDFVHPSIEMGLSHHIFDLRTGQRYCGHSSSSPPDLSRKKTERKKKKREFETKREKRREKRRWTSSVLGNLMGAITGYYEKGTCKTDPLIVTNLVGLWYRRGDLFHGHCVYCGDLTLVKNEKMTNYGLSCMNHPHAEFALDSPHHLAFSALRMTQFGKAGKSSILCPQIRAGKFLNREALQEELREMGGVVRHPHLLDHRTTCALCGHFQTQYVIRVFDEEYRLYEVPLCKVDLGLLRNQLPLLQLGRKHANAVEPISLHILQQELRVILGRSKKTTSS